MMIVVLSKSISTAVVLSVANTCGTTDPRKKLTIKGNKNK
jgi:hypothetical protein